MFAGSLCCYLATSSFVLLSLVSSLALELPRGVPLSKAPLYQVGQPFRCLNGAGEIAWLKLNDDYCDCEDGSDEPGTSACSNGVFQCRDTVYKAVAIPSSMVNDGVCDCCDGSDEYDGLAQCPQTCGALAAAVREARSIKRAAIEEGHRKYKEYIQKLPAIIEQKRLEAEQQEAERKQQEAERKQREAERKQLEAERQQLEAERLAREQEEAAAETPEPSGSVETSAEPTSPPEDIFEGHVPPEDDSGGRQTDEHVGPVAEEDDLNHDEREPPEPEPEPVAPPIDYGPNEGFRMLHYLEECLEFTDPAYTYQLCPFKEVQQRSGSSTFGTTLGKWGHWEGGGGGGDRYAVMVYTDGDGCWNGPRRSTKVHVHCGPENQLLSATEPSRCEYVMYLTTPAACFDDPEVLMARLHPDEL